MQKDNFLMLGYENFNDLINSAFGIRQLSIGLIGGFIATISTFITEYIWDDARAIYTLIGIILIDALTGITRAIKQKTFSSARLPRILIIILIYLGLLSVGWNLSHVSQLYVWIPSVLYGGFVTTLIVSILENCYQIGIIPENIYLLIKTKINLLQSFVFGANFNKIPEPVGLKENIGIYQTDVNGNILYVDSRYCNLVGVGKEEILNGAIKNMIHPDDSQALSANWVNAVKFKLPFKSKYRFINTGGTVFEALSQASPVTDKSGVFIGYLGTFEIIKPS